MPKISADFIELHVCYFHKNKREYLLLKRSVKDAYYPGIWQMITASTEKDELTYDTINRELTEETGLNTKKILVIPRVNVFYLAPADTICLSSVFIAMVNDKNVKLSEEHDEYKWVNFEKAKKMIYWDNQIDSLKLIEKHLSNKTTLKKLIELQP